MAKFPFTLYVKQEKDGSEPYLVLAEELEDLVATGETVEVVTYTRSSINKFSGIVKKNA